jgi:hypothetical protein
MTIAAAGPTLAIAGSGNGSPWLLLVVLPLTAGLLWYALVRGRKS